MQDSYAVFNGKLSVRPNAMPQLAVSLYRKNLTDEDYLIAGASDKQFLGDSEATYARPREVGLSVQYCFAGQDMQ